MRLSVLIPVYNESRYIKRVVEAVLRQDVRGIRSKEIVIVDDGSNDGSSDLLRDLAKQFPQQIVLISHGKNLGKGEAIRSAAKKMTGDICIIQDADFEYDPKDYSAVLDPIIAGRADCVFGSRFSELHSKKVLYYWHYVGNRLLTTLSNMFTNLKLTDISASYKAFRCEILKDIPIRSADFSFEAEVIAKVARRKCRVYEVSVNYSGRTYAEGKKNHWISGAKTAGVILKYGFINDSHHSQ